MSEVEKNTASKDGLDWYLPDEKNQEAQGPFSTDALIERIKKGELRLDQYVWGPHLEGSRWCRFFELSEFKKILENYPKCNVPRRHSKGRAAQLQTVQLSSTKKGEYGIENIYRRYPRAPLEVSVLVHNQEQLRKAESIDISEKGVFVRMDNSPFEKGDEVTATIRNAPVLGTFSVQCVILRVLNKSGYMGYGLYFLRLNPMIRRKLVRYVLEMLQQSSGSPDQKAA